MSRRPAPPPTGAPAHPHTPAARVPRARVRHLRGVVAAVAVACALPLSGCQAVAARFDSIGDDDILGAISLTQDDAADGMLLQPYEGGDQVSGQVSLDLCFGDFPSEQLRVGRRQVGIGSTDTEAWVSSEGILYATPQDAAQAMSELATAAAQCPEDLVDPPQSGRDPLQWQFGRSPDSDWPQVPGVLRQAYQFTVTDAEGQQWSASATYLQRGRMILALYATPEDAAASVIRNAPTAQRFVVVMSQRVLAIPADALETGGAEPVEDSGGISA